MGRTEGPGAPAAVLVDSQTGCHLCSDGSHQSHTHRPVTPRECPCWYKRRKIPLEQTARRGTLLLPCDLQPSTSWSRSLNGLNRGSVCLKWVTAQDTHGWNTFSRLSEENDAFRALKASKSNWHVSAGTQHLDLRRTHFHVFVSGTGYKIGILRTNLIGLFA